MNPPLHFAAVAPMACVAVGALGALLGEVWLTRRGVAEARIGSVLAVLAGLSLALALSAALSAFVSHGPVVFHLGHPMIRLDAFSAFAISLIALAALLLCALSVTYLAELQINHGEYYALVLLATAGMMFLVASTHLMMLFLALELMSLPVYVLAGFDRHKLDSNESALKYFVIGAFASALWLYGAALIYGSTGALHYGALRVAFSAADPLALAGLGLLVAGFAVKVASVPFHQWAPDVYQGAPTTVTALVAVAVQVAAFAAFLRLIAEAFAPAAELLAGVFGILAVLSLLVGNAMALIQDNLKRLLAYATVGHAGTLLIGFAAGGDAAHRAVLFYLATYAFMTLGAFAVIVALANRGRDCEEIDDLAGLAQTRPVLAALLTLFALSLAGLPGTAGFMGKFFVFRAAVDAGATGLALAGVLGTALSFAYYLRIPIAMYMRGPSDAELRQRSSTLEIAVLALCALAVAYFGFFPNGLPAALKESFWIAEGLDFPMAEWAARAADLPL